MRTPSWPIIPLRAHRAASHVGLCLLITVIASVLAPSALGETTTALSRAEQFENKGEFTNASNVLRQALAGNLSAAQRRQIEFQLDRLHRIRLDFPLTQEMLFGALKSSVRNLTRDEFDLWVRQGRFDSREIDGQRRFMSASVPNLLWRYPELNARRFNYENDAAVDQRVLEACRSIKLAAEREDRPYVLPRRFDVTMSVYVDPGAAPPGQIIRAWLPIPRKYAYQDSFQIVASAPPLKVIDAEDSPIRSAYFEQITQTGAPTIFELHYRYTHYGVWFDINAKKVTPFDGKDAAIAPLIRPAPHVVFTPEIRRISKQIIGEERNPADQARKIYDWISAHILYSYSIEYSTIDNLSGYCLSHGYGDCGQDAMLFITLCRLNDIPARWQSGWDIFPGKKDIHDWAEIYLAPYGWVPVDPYMGVMSTRYMTALKPSERREIHDFYFGGLDQWRMAANSDHSQALVPAKDSFRSDDVDFQRGELEAAGRNIYFNHYNYQLDAREIPAAAPPR